MAVNQKDSKIKQHTGRKTKMEQIQRTVERIPSEYTDPLHEYIKQQLQDLSLSEDVRARKSEEYDAYLQAHRLVGAWPYKKSGVDTPQKTVQYGTNGFNELLRIAGLSFRDYFDKIRNPWLQNAGKAPVHFFEFTEDELWLRDTCDNMSPELLDTVRTLAVEMSPAFWTALDEQNMTPTLRLLTLISTKIQKSERRSKLPAALSTDTIVRAIADLHYCTNVTMEDLVVAANAFHVSIHWLMMGDDSIAATAQNPRTERVLTAYLFMSARTKRVFCKAVQYIQYMNAMQNMWEGDSQHGEI